MNVKACVALAAAFCCAPSAPAAVRIVVQDGKTVIYNDGVGESAHAVLRESDGWLSSRIAIPSLYDGLINDAARVNALDPKLVKSVMLIESAFNPRAVSRKGARGLMQLMPETAAQYGVRDILDPAENVAAGAMHLAYLMSLYGGDLIRALAAYNAGETAVARYGGVPPYTETRLYVHKGLAAYYGKATLGGGFGRPQSETWSAVPRKPVRLMRDKNNRPLITTELSVPPALRRS
jgi:soluble lytic murein transglycosylase-like protein